MMGKREDTKMKAIIKQSSSIAKVSSKGQITIPSFVRNAMGLKKGSKLVFIPCQNGWKIKALPPIVPLEQIEGSLKPQVDFKLEDIDRVIAEGIVKNYKDEIN